MASGVGRSDRWSLDGGGDGDGGAGGEVRFTCLLGCGLELERFEDVRSVELGGEEEAVMEFEGRGEEVVEPGGGRRVLIDEETVVVVGTGGGGGGWGGIIGLMKREDNNIQKRL